MGLILSNDFDITDTHDGIVFSERPYICYTLPEDDIYTSRPAFSAFAEKEDRKFSMGKLRAEKCGESIRFTLTQQSEADGFGIVLPFNFMGKKSGKGENRYLLNSIRHDRESGVFYISLIKKAESRRLSALAFFVQNSCPGNFSFIFSGNSLSNSSTSESST